MEITRISTIAEFIIKEKEITKQDLLKKIEDTLNNFTSGDILENVTIYLRPSVSEENHPISSQ